MSHHLYADDTHIYIALAGDTEIYWVIKSVSKLYHRDICLDGSIQTKTQS